MKNALLFPYNARYWGWSFLLLSSISAILLVISENGPALLDVNMPALAAETIFSSQRQWFVMHKTNIADELTAVLFIIGGLLIGFAREKQEDEYTTHLRLQSLMWSVYIHYGLLILAWIFIYEFSFYWVLLTGIFMFLLIFILRLRWVMWQSYKTSNDE